MLIHRSRSSRKSASRKRRRTHGQLTHQRKALFEQLEDRRLLSSMPWYDLARLEDTGVLPNNDDRRSVAVDGDTIVVGSSHDDRSGIDAGVAHIYTRDDAGTPNDPGDDSWPLRQVLLPNDLGPYDWFGNSVAIDGDTLVVSALHPTSACCPSPVPGDGWSVAYVFERDVNGTWNQTEKFEGGFNEGFSWRVDVEGDLIAVSSRNDNETGIDAGVVFLYRKKDGSWHEEAKLVDPQGQTGDTRFTSALAIDQGEVVVGSIWGDGIAVGSGVVQVFSEASPGQWSLDATLQASDGQLDDWFGSSVAKEGNTIVVGAEQTDVAGDNSGAAYVFVRENGSWTQEAKLLSSDLEAEDRFGRQVEIENQTIAVGSWFGNGVVPDSGAVYFFDRVDGNWTEVDKIFESTAGLGDPRSAMAFGSEMNWDGETFVVSNGANDFGHAYVFVPDSTRTRTPFLSTDTPKSLKDMKGKNPGVTTSELVITDAGTIIDIDVRLDISHNFDSDLKVELLPPSGPAITLVEAVGGSGNNFTGTILDDAADQSIEGGSAPFQGLFRPTDALSALNDQQLTGTWTLRITDNDRGDSGTLNSWSISARYQRPAPSFSINDVSVTEGDSGTTLAEFTVTRSGDLSQTVMVDYATADGTAIAGSDYTSIGTTTLTFDPGVSSLPVAVAVIGDTEEEPNETFVVNLSNPVGATIAAGGALGTAEIVDDDSSAELGTLYIYDIRFDSKRHGKDWRAVVEIRSAVDDAPVAGVTVKVDFAGTTYTLVTDSNGIARTSWERNLAEDNYYADAYDLALEGFVWNPFLDLEDDSDGDGKPDDLLLV